MIKEIMILSGRNIKRIVRNGEAVLTIFLVPIGIFLLNYFVLAAQSENTSLAMTDLYAFMAILSVVMGISYTGHRVHEDKKSNMFSRMKSLAIHQSAFLWSHVVTTVLATFISLMTITGLSFVLGIESPANIGHWGLVLVGLLALTVALSWLMVAGGLIAKSTAGASAFYYLIISLTFLSPNFLGALELPTALRIFTDFQPISVVTNGLVQLLTYGSLHLDLGIGLLWSMTIFLLSYIIARRVYKEKLN